MLGVTRLSAARKRKQPEHDFRGTARSLSIRMINISICILQLSSMLLATLFGSGEHTLGTAFGLSPRGRIEESTSTSLHPA